jgi:hypothetical protein
MLSLAICSAAGAADSTDLHRLWDSACADCHGHSAEFSRRLLEVRDKRLLGRHHREDLLNFMHRHYLRADSVDAVYRMLLAQAQTPPRFREECGSCHGSAVELLRASDFRWQGNSLRLGSDLGMREFLNGHRGLQPADVDFYQSLFERIAVEIGRPPG